MSVYQLRKRLFTDTRRRTSGNITDLRIFCPCRKDFFLTVSQHHLHHTRLLLILDLPSDRKAALEVSTITLVGGHRAGQGAGRKGGESEGERYEEGRVLGRSWKCRKEEEFLFKVYALNFCLQKFFVVVVVVVIYLGHNKKISLVNLSIN